MFFVSVLLALGLEVKEQAEKLGPSSTSDFEVDFRVDAGLRGFTV